MKNLLLLFLLSLCANTLLANETITITWDDDSEADSPWYTAVVNDPDEPNPTANFTAKLEVGDSGRNDNHQGYEKVKWTVDVGEDSDIDLTDPASGKETTGDISEHVIAFEIPTDVAGTFEIEVTAEIHEKTDADHGDEDDGDGRNTYTLTGTATLYILKIEMTRPDDKARSRYFHYAFNSDSPGVCNIVCNVTVSPDNEDIQNFLKDNLQWSIDPIIGSTLTWQNGESDTGVGVYIGGAWKEKAIFTTLPDDNDEFGIKNVILTIDDLDFSLEGKAKVFFRRDAKNHPGEDAGETPNWYFYWSQTEASFGVHEYYGPGSDGNGRSYMSFIGGKWRSRIGNSVTTKTITINSITYPKGIDHFAFTTRHEERHRIDLSDLWGGASSNRVPIDDLDSDGIPDDKEDDLVPSHPYDPSLKATHIDTWNYGKDGWSDMEDYALRRQEYPNPGNYNSVDWASPGSQWNPPTIPPYTDY